MILRWLTVAAGAVNVVLLYLLGKRYLNAWFGLPAAQLAAPNPLLIFNDLSGMAEPISFALLLAGALWGLAAMTRGEAWLLSAGMEFAAMFSHKSSQRKVAWRWLRTRRAGHVPLMAGQRVITIENLGGVVYNRPALRSRVTKTYESDERRT